MAAVMQTVGLGITRVITFAGMPSAPADLLRVEECAPLVIALDCGVSMATRVCNAVRASNIHVLVAPGGMHWPMIAAELQVHGRFPGVHGSLPLVPATAEL